MKMTAIGSGKFAGAQKYHTHAQRLGLEHVIRTAGRRVLQSGKMIGGLAIVEDAHHNTARIDAVPADCMEQRDEENLALAKSWMPKLPCDLDVLIVDQMGKNISGTGMDAKVVNRGPSVRIQPVARTAVDPAASSSASWIPGPTATRMGIGMADVTTDRLVRQIDWEPDTRQCAELEACRRAFACRRTLPPIANACSGSRPRPGRWILRRVTYGWIRNTLELDRVAVSDNLRAQIDGHPQVEVEKEIEVTWDECGNLVSPFG